MARRPQQVRIATGVALVLLTLATRLPFLAHTLFEFDSIDFAVAIFRFSLEQVTPHMPGYILHILLGRAMYLLTGDLNTAYLAVSVLLSVASVLLLWRAAAALRGERVAVVAAVIWLTTPLFWFQGEVATVYTQESFYASLLLYLGLALLRSPGNRRFAYLTAVALALATGTRQTSLLFFLPAVVYLFWRVRLPLRHIAGAAVSFAAVAALWLTELFRESGGAAVYRHYASLEHIYKTQSLLFGNSLSAQLEPIIKVGFSLPVSLGAALLAVIVIVVCFPQRTLAFVGQHLGSSKLHFVALIALPPLLFYTFIYFMKAAYLLNIVPSLILSVAVLVDQAAIWSAERVKRLPENKLRLTRPIITRRANIFAGLIVIANVVWFVAPWPGTNITRYDDENTRNSFVYGAGGRFKTSGSRIETISNRIFSTTNVSGITSIDALNDTTYRALVASGANTSGSTVITTWWSRWAYLELPKSTVIDVTLSGEHQDSLDVGVSRDYVRRFVRDSIVEVHASTPVLLLMRSDRPDFPEVASQVHLVRLPMPQYLDIYRITDSAFTLRWRGRIFVKR